MLGYNCFSFFNIIRDKDKKGGGRREDIPIFGVYGCGNVECEYDYLG